MHRKNNIIIRKNISFMKAIVLSCILYPYFLYAQKIDTTKSVYSLSLEELSRVEISTGMAKSTSYNDAPANVQVITQQMIVERGYQTLTDICQDIPGFDFMMYNDGGGEYPGYSKNRGLGSVGNPEILIMIDGVVQNDISFNWSLLWTYGNMLVDVEQIEIVQGPGSVMYGAQAYTGVINIITKKHFKGLYASSALGSYSRWKNEIFYGTDIKKNLNFTIALQQFHAKGDMGLDSYDPGGYFHGNKYPDTILADYDKNGDYVQDKQNPLAGTFIPDGFNTQKNSYVIRSNISYKNTRLGFFYSDYQRGNASGYLAYEYDLTDKESMGHYRAMNIFMQNDSKLNPRLSLNSNLVYRTTSILPKTGFKYLYRFPGLVKSYNNFSYQFYFEEKFLYEISTKSKLLVGVKAGLNRKSIRIISLGEYNYLRSGTSSSWNIAVNGGGLNQPMSYPVYYEREASLYGLWDYNWTKRLKSSIGLRYDYNSYFGSILNPRLNVVYKPLPAFNVKLLFGTAFRQPGIFELYDEFRGNPGLKPEKISTGELDLSSLILQNKIGIKLNIFYSDIKQYIGKVPDSTKLSLERYENLAKINYTGLSLLLSVQITKKIRFYSNYSFLSGMSANDLALYEIEGIARKKANAGINIDFLKHRFIVDLRFNYVGRRLAPSTNQWLQRNENGYAPSYLKGNLVITYRIANQFSLQFIVNNILDEQYYGLGRETGNGYIDAYEHGSNSNPEGHIPSYHPQLGRTFLATISYKF
ncbi:MAG: TonB-dependent receptor [Chlorobi bacterium]|nr:TonB-dependent receptor [Chlorobiota bacterium]